MLTLHNVFEKQKEHPTRSRVVRLQGGRSTTGMVGSCTGPHNLFCIAQTYRVRFPYSHRRERKILCVLIKKRGLVFHWVCRVVLQDFGQRWSAVIVEELRHRPNRQGLREGKAFISRDEVSSRTATTE